MFYSPLRYPGGKNKLAVFLAKICLDNKIHSHYVEPFAGGSSVALFLLLEGYVKNITINDKDRSIYAFWHSVIYNSEKLCKLIDETDVTLTNWQIQREVQKKKNSASLLRLGFSTLFMNRTNRSGIIKGGAIGGTEQLGDYKIDCRFNKDEIKGRIRLIAANRKNITLHNLDAIDLIDNLEESDKLNDSIFYFDPPYYLKAESLYMNHFKDGNHEDLALKIRSLKNCYWIVSYDDHSFIRDLYSDLPTKNYSFNHSAFSAREGKEILVFSRNLVQPNVIDYNPILFKIKRTKVRQEIMYIEK